MKRWRWIPAVALGLVLVCAWSARASDVLTADVLALLSRGEAVQARELLAEADALPPRTRSLLDYACSLVESPNATPALGVQGEVLAAAAEPDEADLLRSIQAALGPRGAYLDALVDASYAAVARAGRDELLRLCSSGDPRTRRVAVAAIGSWLAPLRARVSAGGHLEPAELSAVEDAALIEGLIARLPERAVALDRIPPELAVEVPQGATAFHALVLIEEPALPALHAAYPAEGTEVTIAAITSAIDLRRRRFPGSSWGDARPAR